MFSWKTHWIAPYLLWNADISWCSQTIAAFLHCDLLLLVDILFPEKIMFQPHVTADGISDMRLRIVNLRNFKTKTLGQKEVVPFRFDRASGHPFVTYIRYCQVRARKVFVGVQINQKMFWAVWNI